MGMKNSYLLFVITLEIEWRQHRSQEMSVRALGRVVYQDGLQRLKTLYAV